MNPAMEPIDGGNATLAELRRAGIDALVKALDPVGMARFLQQFDPGQGSDYTAERSGIHCRCSHGRDRAPTCEFTAEMTAV